MIPAFVRATLAALLFLLACETSSADNVLPAGAAVRAQTGVHFYAPVERFLASELTSDADEGVAAVEVDLLDGTHAVIGVAVLLETGELLGPDAPTELRAAPRAALANDLLRAFFPQAFRACVDCHSTGDE